MRISAMKTMHTNPNKTWRIDYGIGMGKGFAAGAV